MKLYYPFLEKHMILIKYNSLHDVVLSLLGEGYDFHKV